jgi:hypothetical protein
LGASGAAAAGCSVTATGLSSAATRSGAAGVSAGAGFTGGADAAGLLFSAGMRTGLAAASGVALFSSATFLSASFSSSALSAGMRTTSAERASTTRLGIPCGGLGIGLLSGGLGAPAPCSGALGRAAGFAAGFTAAFTTTRGTSSGAGFDCCALGNTLTIFVSVSLPLWINAFFTEIASISDIVLICVLTVIPMDDALVITSLLGIFNSFANSYILMLNIEHLL